MKAQTSGGMPYDRTGRYWHDPGASQGMPRTCGHHQNLERGKEVFHPASQREQGLDDILISDC